MSDIDYLKKEWLNKLLWNLYSYTTFVFPLLFLVFLIKHKYCFPFFANSALVKLIVFGKEKSTVINIEQSNQLLSLENDQKDTFFETEFKSFYLMEKYKKQFKIIFCFIGLHSSYLIWGLFQEKIMTTKYLSKSFSNHSKINDSSNQSNLVYFRDAQFLVLINRLFAFLIAIICLVINRSRKTNSSCDKSSKTFVIAPLYEFVFCSISNVISSWCQYEALKFVNFPTQVLSKACKIPSVMLMSRLVMGKKISHFEYLCSILLSIGMIIFLFGNHQAHLHSNSSGNEKLFNGLLVLALYLTFDSFTSNWEEKMYHKYKISTWQLMAVVNFYSITLTLLSLIQQGDLIPALLIVTNSVNLFSDCIFLSFSSTVGQFFVFYTISNFGALIFATIMILRQIFSVILSYLIYGHKITFTSFFGILIVFSSLLVLKIFKMNKSKT